MVKGFCGKSQKVFVLKPKKNLRKITLKCFMTNLKRIQEVKLFFGEFGLKSKSKTF